MGRRFGRNQKRELKQRIKELELAFSYKEEQLEQLRKDTNRAFQLLKIESKPMAFQVFGSPIWDSLVPQASISIQVDPAPLMFGLRIDPSDLINEKFQSTTIVNQVMKVLHSGLNIAIPGIIDKIRKDLQA